MVSVTAELAPAPQWVADYADLVGKPFKLQARGPDAFDCYGLVLELAKRAGRSLPEYVSPATIDEVPAVVVTKSLIWTPCEPGPGAVVTLRLLGKHVSHVGVVLPHDKMVHVWQRSGGVCVERLEAWRHRIVGFYRPDAP